MKKVKYLAMLLAAGMFAACSDNLEDAAGAGNAGGTTPSTTEGYVKVAINMPTTSGGMSRADDRPDSDGDTQHDVELTDGVVNEYKITDGVIIFFKTTSDDAAKDPDKNATFDSAYKLEGLTITNDPSAQVTERVATVTEAPMVNTGEGEALYALVVLNTPSTLVVDADKHTLKLNDQVVTTADKLEKFTTAFTGSLTTYIGENKDDFTMSNAPLSTEDGADNTYSSTTVAKTLVPVTVYETQEAAEANPAARIYVERVAAKVTLKGFTEENYTKTVQSQGVYNGDIVQLQGWALNVTNKSTSLVRNVAGFVTSTVTGSWLATTTPNEISRFAGTEVIPINDKTNYYRIYWAQDGNYTSATPASDFDTFYTGGDGNITPSEPSWNQNTADKATATNDYALYCLENTMDYSQQKNDRSTTVVLKTQYLTKFGDGKATAQSFFICGTNPTKYPATDVAVTTPEAGTIDGICSYIVKEANKVLATESQITASNLTIKESASAGTYRSLAEIKNLFDLTSGTDEQWNAIWNQIGTIKYYKGGISYYYDDIYVRHFNDTDTPWNDGEEYGIQHLGRYGVVRNNWYEINVSSISGPGEPSINKPEEEDNQRPLLGKTQPKRRPLKI